MSLALAIVVFLVAIVIAIISLVYASRASTSLSSVTNYNNDANLTSAHRYLVWISVIGWLVVIFLFFALFASLEDSFEVDVIYIATVVAIVLMLAIGVIASIAANRIGNSSRYPTTNQQGTDSDNLRSAYRFSVISASTALGTLILAIIALISVRALQTDNVPHNKEEG